MTEQTNTPELRFPGFNGEWRFNKLGDLTTKIGSGKTPKGGSQNYLNAGIPFLRSQNIQNGKLNLDDLVYIDSKTDETMKNSKSYFGDILLNITGASIGRSAINSIDNTHINLNQHVCIIRLKKQFSYKFLGNFLLSPRGQKKIFKAQSGGSREGLNFKEIANINLYIPDNFNEQEKLGKFFSKLDHQIELEEEKLELLEQQKRGYMQKIFSQELRFKDDNGNDYPNWENEKLGNLINEVNERTTSNNQYMLLSSTKNGLLSQEEYFKKQIGSKDSTGYKILRLNQLVLSPQNLWLGNINFNQRFDTGIVSPSYRIYNLSHQFDINFAKDLLKSPRYIYEYAQASEQGASVVRRNLNLELFYSIKISLPSIEEQRKIGVFLNKLDKLIRKQYNKIEVLKQRKKGLLQKMFI